MQTMASDAHAAQAITAQLRSQNGALVTKCDGLVKKCDVLEAKCDGLDAERSRVEEHWQQKLATEKV
jgi:hypothetical protein